MRFKKYRRHPQSSLHLPFFCLSPNGKIIACYVKLETQALKQYRVNVNLNKRWGVNEKLSEEV